MNWFENETYESKQQSFDLVKRSNEVQPIHFGWANWTQSWKLGTGKLETGTNQRGLMNFWVFFPVIFSTSFFRVANKELECLVDEFKHKYDAVITKSLKRKRKS